MMSDARPSIRSPITHHRCSFTEVGDLRCGVAWHCDQRKPLVAMNTLHTTDGFWIFNDQGN
jgi:hypothetical protein